MTSTEVHKEHIKEQAINAAIAVGIEKRPATIGLHTSACSISLLELYLHASGKITAGTMIKHEWFKTPRPGQKIVPLAERKLEADFQDKEKLFSLMYTIEESRNKLIYGKPSKTATEEVLNSFQRLKDIITQRLKELGEEIE
mgnify:CR=1 FL=1